jgi:hypothetical protein
LLERDFKIPFLSYPLLSEFAGALNRDGVSGDLLVCELGGLPGLLVTVVGGLELCRWDVAAVFIKPSVVEPVDPLQGGDLDVVGGAPRAFRFDQFGLCRGR